MPVAAARRRVPAGPRPRRAATRALPRSRPRRSSRPRSTACASSCAGAASASRSPTCSGAGASTGSSCTATPRALVPRPETEVLVERCLALLDGNARPAHRRRRHGHGRDRAGARGASPRSERDGDRHLARTRSRWPRENAGANGLAERVELLEGDLLDAGRRAAASTWSPRTRPTSPRARTSTPRSRATSPRWPCTPSDAGRAIHERLAAGAPAALRARRAPRRRGRRGPGAVARRAPRRARLRGDRGDARPARHRARGRRCGATAVDARAHTHPR